MLLAARLEAVIDFGEDEELADDVAAGVLPLVRALRQRLEAHLAAAAGGELVRCGCGASRERRNDCRTAD